MAENPGQAVGIRRHIPNLITLARAAVGMPYFVVLAFPESQEAMAVAAALFLVSMAGDIADGWLARRWGAESVLGRVMDPFIDKVIIVGSLIYCINVPPRIVAPWMVVLVLVRELGVTALRGYVESLGTGFPAVAWGKAKTFVQCVAITAVLVTGAMAGPEPPAGAVGMTVAFVWIMVAVVVLSGLAYLWRAWPILRHGPR